MLLAAGAEVNAASRETMKLTPLASALATGQNEIARTLIDHGANVNAKGENDVTPLHTAAARGNIDAATLLLEHGADITPRLKMERNQSPTLRNATILTWWSF